VATQFVTGKIEASMEMNNAKLAVSNEEEIERV
jgi:hypothetical protein